MSSKRRKSQLFRPRRAVLVQHRHSDTALLRLLARRCRCFPQETGSREFVSWPLGMIPAAETPGEPKLCSPSLSASPGPLHPRDKVLGC